MNIKTLTRTCYACPSQWEGVTDDNRQVYIRYRHGSLSVSVGESGDEDEMAGVRGTCIFARPIGDAFDGMLEYADLKKILEGDGIAKLPEAP